MASSQHIIAAESTNGFRAAAAYDAHRPSYPPEAVNKFLASLKIANETGAKVVEIGAGTGKFTELLAARSEDYEIKAVEPHAEMRSELARKGLKGVKVLDGHAEGGMPVEDGWGDACVAAQAFHWFATEKALKEIQRTLRSGAVFGMIWNLEDYNKPQSWPSTTKWEQTLNDWVYTLPTDHPRFRDMKWQAIFDSQLESNPLTAVKDILTHNLPMFSVPLGQESVPWTVWLTPEALWDRIGTLSQVVLLKDDAKTEAKRKFDETLKGDDVEKNEKGEVAVHGITYMAWTDRL